MREAVGVRGRPPRFGLARGLRQWNAGQILDFVECQHDRISETIASVSVEQAVLAGVRAQIRLGGQRELEARDRHGGATLHPFEPYACASSASGTADTTASVVNRRLATDAAFWSAERTTFVGSMTPAFTRFS